VELIFFTFHYSPLHGWCSIHIVQRNIRSCFEW